MDAGRDLAQLLARGAMACLAALGPAVAVAQAPGCTGAGCAVDAPNRAATPPACGAGGNDVPQRQFDRGCLAKSRFAPPERAEACPPGHPGCAGDVPAGEPLESIVVYGSREAEDPFRPTIEQRFAAALVQGNPEVNGGKMRHGAFYALGMYWGAEPLSFLYYNLRYGLFE